MYLRTKRSHQLPYHIECGTTKCKTSERSVIRDLRFRHVVYWLLYICDGLQQLLYGIEESLRFSTAEQKKETLRYEPPERAAGGRIRLCGLNDLDKRLQKF